LSKYTAVELLHSTKELDVGLLVCAAGFGSCGPFLESELEHEVEMLRVNCEAVMTQALLFGRRFTQRGRGGIVLLSSAVGFHGAPYFAHYAATKAYVQSLGEALHVELAPHGIDVLASAPGPTKTGFAERAGMNLDNAMSPELVARATLQSLGKKATVIPGFVSKLIAYGFSPTPRRARIWIIGNVMRRRAKGKSSASADSGRVS
jgi:short-subunit dehydrogenase